jgi:hypothetical protein
MGFTINIQPLDIGSEKKYREKKSSSKYKEEKKIKMNNKNHLI